MPRRTRALPREKPPQDDRIVAALAHAAIILPFWGLLASVVIWATQKDKSRFVRFQALQAIAYQCLQVIVYLLCVPLYFCCLFGMAFVISISPPTVGGGGRLGTGETGMMFFTGILPLLFVMLWFFVWLIYTGYGVYGAWSVLKGKDFRYIILGSRLERYLSQ